MREGMKPFLEAGVQKYAEAKDTVAAFERAMGELIEDTVRSRGKWSPLKSERIGRPKPGGSGGGYWIAISVTGQSRGKKKEIDCGLWWKVPQTATVKIAGPIIYAEFYELFSWPKPKQGIRSFKLYGNTFLYLALGKPQEIKKELNRLLDVLLIVMRKRGPSSARS